MRWSHSVRSVTAVVAASLWPAVAQAGPVVDAPGGATTPPPAYGGCAEDPYEPDSMAAPQPLSPGRLDNLVLCASNDDYWQIPIQAGDLVRIRIDFSHAAGDVDMALHAPDYSQIAISEGVVDFEELTYQGDHAETLLLRVYGYQGVTNRYSLTLEVEGFGVGCVGDVFEPNDDASRATLGQSRGEGRVCVGDSDWYAIDLTRGEGFDFGIDFDSGLSPLSVGLYRTDDTSRPIRVARSRAGFTSMVVDTVESGGRYYVRVFANDDGFNRYTYSFARYAPGGGTRGQVTGRVEYQDELRGEDIVIGADWLRWNPARSVPVELIRAADGRVIATTYTDERGAYSLPFAHRAGGPAFVRVTARLEAPGYLMRVIEHEETRAPHRADSAPLEQLARGPDGTYQSDFRFESTGPLGGAFNITDRSLDAFRFIERHRSPSDLELTVIWQRGRPHGCTSCFENNTIYLGGGFDDPDEYDDSVILHEFGHFVVHSMSHDDSPGGSHNGDRTDPLVAYGEGIATVFAMMVDASPIYTDTMTTGGLLQDFERAPFQEVTGTSTGTVMGQVSEYLVVALLWDLRDAAVESHDRLAAGDGAIMAVLFDYMPTMATRDQGVAGADLADFVQGFRTLFPEHTDQLDELLSHYRFPGGNLVQASPIGK